MGTGMKFSALIIGLFSFLATAPGQSPAPVDDPIAVRLQEAKEAYRQEVEKSRALVFKALDEVDERARDDADVDLVRSIKADRAAFEATGKPPKSGLTTEYIKRREAMRKTMFDAYTTAIRDYLKARKDDLAQKVKEDRDEFQRAKAGGDQGQVEASPQPDFGVAKFDEGGEEVRGVKVRVGDPQFTLIWDSTVDLDLHVLEPGGKEIFWNDRKGTLGGELDVDNVEGFGPENIGWPVGRSLPVAPPGEYQWFVSYYGGNRGIPLSTKWKVRVKRDGKVDVYSGTLAVPGARSKTYPLQIEPPRAAR